MNNRPETVGEILEASNPNRLIIPPYIKIYQDLEQGSPEWHAAKCGILSASRTKEIITAAKLDYSTSKDAKRIVYKIATERVNQFAKDEYQSYAMIRGKEEEIYAYDLYNRKYSPLHTVGFVTNSRYGGFILGCSPDGLTQCGEGMIEAKSRENDLQFETIVKDEMPSDYMLQVQTALLVTERKWCDFLSYSNGMPMFVKRILPDPQVQAKIVEAAIKFHEDVDAAMETYSAKIALHKFHATERRIEDITA